jgi:hypothetical protein
VIGRRAFENTLLTSVTIPSSVARIEGYAFANTRLTSVIVPDSVKIIDNLAFAENLYLAAISIPDGLLELGEKVFEKNYSLTSILYCGRFSAFLPIAPTCPPQRQALIDAAAKAAAAKKTTITCVKGKLTKKVIAVNPKCPKGYKKK